MSNSKHYSTSSYQKSSSYSKHNHGERSNYNSRSSKKQKFENSQDRRGSSSYCKNIEDNEEYEDEKEQHDEIELNQEDAKYLEASYVQTTLIPIYYSKNAKNQKVIDSTSRLNDLCNKFENDLIKRSKNKREKSEAVPIPNYRQLLQTRKFSNFSTCNCDQPSHQKHHHNNHNHSSSKKSLKKRNLSTSTTEEHQSSDDSSSSSSSSSSYSSDSDSSDSCLSDDSQNDKNKKLKKENKVSKKKKDGINEDDDEFDDIRSMEIHRKSNHPDRLHSDLTFNEHDQTNEGPLCKCKLKNTTFGTRHQIYYGEELIPPCDENSNNADKLYHYRMTITPYTNFIHKIPTFIEYDKHEYLFEGFSLFSHEKLPEMPDCVVVIYNHEYKLNVVAEEMIENFTVKELELLKTFIFEEILELYDLKWKGFNIEESGCNRFHMMPRFCRTLPYNGKEILSPCEILKYFIENSVPVVSQSFLSRVAKMSESEWERYVENIQGTLVTYPGKRPSTIRLDQLDRDHLLSNSSSTKTNYPLIIHFNMFRNTWLPMMKNNLKLKKLYHKYFKLRHLLNNKAKLSTDDKTKLRTLGDQLQAMIKKSSEVQKEIMIELSSENFYCTGIRTDVVQQAVVIPTFVEHLRFHISLKFLEDKIGYTFKNRLLLQYALTHPSGAFLLHQNLGCNPDHVRNTLYNCRARNPNYGDLTSQKRKSLLRKKGIHMLFSIMSQKAHDIEESSCISNYERLEFLGDKILELLTSKHLFFLFPMFDEGQLSEYRNALVQNQYLAILARKLDMHYFIIFYHGVDLCSNSALNHALANSFEALLAAVFLDSDLDTVSNMLCRILWDDMELKSVWHDLPLHPIQAQQPDGDRHLIATTKILQHVQKFEEMIGVEFTHIRLLAQAFCTRSASFNLITLGDNQRLEFLGDTVLNFVVSNYLYRYFPKHHEGHLSLLRSSLVCNSTQALLYDEFGMADFVLTSYINNNRSENRGNLKRKADVFEAFVGALYIDQGLEAVVVFCNVCMFNKLQDIILYQFWNDPKSRLQQCCLSLRDVDESKPALPTYKLIEEKGPPNRKQYKVAVYFMRKRIGEGIGKSIHESEVEAAKNALKINAGMFPILNKYVMSQSNKILSNDESKCVVVESNDKKEVKKEDNIERENDKNRVSKRKHDHDDDSRRRCRNSHTEVDLEEGECPNNEIEIKSKNDTKPIRSVSYSSIRETKRYNYSTSASNSGAKNSYHNDREESSKYGYSREYNNNYNRTNSYTSQTYFQQQYYDSNYGYQQQIPQNYYYLQNNNNICQPPPQRFYAPPPQNQYYQRQYSAPALQPPPMQQRFYPPAPYPPHYYTQNANIRNMNSPRSQSINNFSKK